VNKAIQLTRKRTGGKYARNVKYVSAKNIMPIDTASKAIAKLYGTDPLNAQFSYSIIVWDLQAALM